MRPDPLPKHLPWWATYPPVGFYAEALKRALAMSNSPEGQRVHGLQGLQQKKSGKTRSAIDWSTRWP